MTVISGSLIVLTCTAFGIPEPQLTWNVDGGSDGYTTALVASSDTYYTIQSLSIESVSLDDNGTYTCIAMNRGGSANATTQLNVLGLIIQSTCMCGRVYACNIDYCLLMQCLQRL